MEPLSPRSTNHPPRPRRDMKKAAPVQKTHNPDKIDDRWTPASNVSEPGNGVSYQMGKKLGKGGFAVCYEGTDSNTGKLFAMKIVKSHVEQKKQLEKVSECPKRCCSKPNRSISFERSFRFMLKCDTQISLSSTALLRLQSIHTLFSSCVLMVRLWK